MPVFESVKEAVAATGANAAVSFVPARFAGDAIVEAADNLVPLIVCITEWIPVLDMVKICAHVRAKGCRLVGPNCPGIMTPGCCKMGILPGNIFMPGPVGIVSRSGTLTYEIARRSDQSGRRAIHVRGDRRRPDHRLDVHGHPGPLRRGPTDRGDRHDR